MNNPVGKTHSLWRILSLILVMAMVVGSLPIIAFANNDDSGVITLDTAAVEDGDNMFSIITTSSTVDEGKTYEITVARSGLAEDEASVDLKTIDISAEYGTDYRIASEEFDTEVQDTNGIILKQVTDYDEQANRRSAANESIDELQSAVDTSDDVDADENTVQEEPASQDNEGEKSLAELKQEQTGKETRETLASDFTPLQEMFMQNASESFGEGLESSSITKINFAPGEIQKTVKVEILDDSISEGNEIVDLVLSNASDGYVVGAGVNCTLTIIDNEPVEYSKLSFKDAEFTAEDGSVKITVERSGAEYSFCTVMVRTTGADGATEGVDYARVDAELTFEPYSNEYVFAIPIRTGRTEKSFDLELYDLKGADLGEQSTATVKIPKTVDVFKQGEQSDETASLANDDEKSFEIELDKKYTVKYKSGDTVGRIYDTNYNPEILVGDYYFARGGSYGHYSGYGSPSWRDSYVKTGEGENGAGFCAWYDWRTWKNGSSYFYAKGGNKALLNTRDYQYLSLDWKQTRSVYGGQRVGFELTSPLNETLNLSKTKIEKTGDFGRHMSERNVLLNSSDLPTANNVDVRVYAIDQESNRTPKIEFYTYGIAAMYRKFNINLLQPDSLSYLKADGKKVSEAPATVELGEGHNTRYYGQNLQIKVNETNKGEPIKGKLTKYIITTGTAKDKQVTFEYTPKGDNIQNIAFDDDFIKVLDQNTKQVSVSNNSFYTDVRIQPVFEYVNAEVEVLKDANGSFANSDLTVGKHTYHIGDTLHIDGTPVNANYYYVGFAENAYKTASDTKAVVSGNMNGVVDLMLDNARYVIKPNFSNTENHIRVNMTAAAKEKLSLLNTVPESSLPTSLQGADGYVLNTGDTGYGYNPTVGKIYQIQAIQKNDSTNGKVYRPVFTSSTSSETANGNVFDFVAGSYPADNIITIDVEEVDQSAFEYFEVDGLITVPGDSIRTSAFNVTEVGAQGVTVMVGGKESKLYNTSTNSLMKIVDRQNATTGEKGEYSIKGIYAVSGDKMTMSISNGDVERVEYITVSNVGLTKTPVEYTERIYDEATKTTIDKVVTRDLYVMNCGTKNMPIRTPLSPYVSSLKYTVDPIPDLVVDTRDNAIPIVATKLHVTAGINLNGREVKSVIFTRVSKNGSREEKQVDAIARGQISFTADYQMDTSFDDGDMLYVSLIDSEDRIITTAGTDENGNAISITSAQPRRYFDVFTGLTFYIPELEVEPQTYDVTSLTAVDIPVLGDMAPNLQSGGLSFTKTKLSDDENAPYYYQFLFTPGVSTMAKQTAMTTLNALQTGQNNVYNQMASEPNNEEALMGENLNNLFNPNDTDHSVSDTINDNAFKKSLSNMSKGVKFDVHLTILLSFYFSYIPGADGAKGQYEMTGGQYCIGAYAGIAKVFYWTVYGVPMYVKLSGNVEIDFSGNYTTKNTANITETDFKYAKNLNDLLNPQNYLMMSIGGRVDVGVGICGVIGVRGIVKVDFVFRFKYGENVDEYMDGFLFKLGGGFGIDLFIFSFEYAPDFVTAGTGVYAKKSASLADSDKAGSFVVRPLNRGKSDLSDFGEDVQLQSADQNPSSYQILAENVAERTKPCIATLENGNKILFFLDSDSSRNNINAMCLYYSICDTNGQWSTPIKVDDNGTCDTLPVVKVYGNEALVSWSDANKTFEEDAQAQDVLASLEIAYAVYNGDTNTMSAKEVLTNDNFMDNNANFAYSEQDGMVICHYVKRDIAKAVSDTDLVDVGATYTTLAYKLCDENGWGKEWYLDIPCQDLKDPLILDFDSEYTERNGKDYALLTYSIDRDADISTDTDRDVYLMITDLTDGISFYPIQITNDYYSDISPKFTDFDGETYLSWVSNAKDFCLLNITSGVQEIEDKGKLNNYLSQNSSDPNWYKLSASDLGMADDEYEGTIFNRLASSTFKNSVVDFSDEEYKDRNIGSYELYNNNNESMYLLWLDNVGEDSNTANRELFGAVLERNKMEANGDSEDITKNSTWSKAVQITEFGHSMDEFSAAFDDNERMSLCANMYDQYIAEDSTMQYSENSLILINFERESALTATGGIEFETLPLPGAETAINFSVANKGFLTSNGYDLKVTQVQNGAETVLCDEHISDVLLSGDSDKFSIPWTVPNSIDGLSINISIFESGVSSEPVTESVQIEKMAEIVPSDTTAEYDGSGNAVLTTTLTNNGNMPSGKIVLNAKAKDSEDGTAGKQYGTLEIDSLAAAETRTVSVPLENFKASEINKFGNADIFIDVINNNETRSSFAVLNQYKIADVEFSCGDLAELNVGDSLQILGTVLPEIAEDKTLVYSSSDNTIAAVTTDGLTTGVANGTAVITATNPDTGFSKSVSVNVVGGSEPTPSKRPSSVGGGSGNNGYSTNSPTPAPTTVPTSTPTSEAGTMPFTDVSVDDWFYDSIMYVYEMGLFNGTSDTTFEPDTAISRAMLVTVLGRANNVSPELITTSRFTDVNTEEYYAPYVEWAAENGIVDGNGDGTFSPDININREEMAKILLGYYKYIGQGPVGEWAIRLDYTDLDQISDWAMDGVMFCTMKGLMQGKEDGRFDPQGEATRAETATILERMTKPTE